MCPTVKALVDIASVRSIEALCSLIRSIRSPIIDEIESNVANPHNKLQLQLIKCVFELFRLKVGMLFLSTSDSILFFNFHVNYKRHSIEMKAKEFGSYESGEM
ncbi:hypothetical protein TSUD_137510 [Trifolium subterraneum]|uniref:Uncharacterized protein n=1 Tax=Trifolium subterraneum TaxID=3900 RepID=A0A2Z6NYM8_TRISU|nr:hypothetical protein TSUD_137510 [Trifolium subterraneum]